MKIQLLLSTILISFLFVACAEEHDYTKNGNKTDADSIYLGDWAKAPQFSGSPRAGAVCFQIGEAAYIGLGADIGGKGLKDFWKFQHGSWSQIKDFPGAPRWGAVAFVVEGRAYVGTGYHRFTENTQENKQYKDFWEYNPATNAWDSVRAEFPGAPVTNAVAFAIGRTGYVGTGFLYRDNVANKDYVSNSFYSFQGDAQNGTWKEMSNEYKYPGVARQGAVAFVINDIAYVCLGASTYQGNGNLTDVYRFDPNATGEKWITLGSLTDSGEKDANHKYSQICRTYASAFKAKNLAGEERAYIIGGTNGQVLRSCFEYNPQLDLWTRMTDLQGEVTKRV